MLAALALAAPAAAAADVGAVVAGAGGASGPSAAGGTEFGAPLGTPRPPRPVATLFRVRPSSIRAGTAPRVSLRVDERGVDAVRARVVFSPIRGRGRLLRLDLGTVRTGRSITPRWPSGYRLSAGRYDVRLHVKDPAGATLLRRARASGRTMLVVRPRSERVPPKPAPAPAPAPDPVPATPAPATSGIFPIAGPHTYAGRDGSFGADRGDHTHQGQDMPAAEGTPVVAPLAGTITTQAYQRDGAGYYVVQRAVDGRSFVYAHCQKDSFGAVIGQSVTAGQTVCRVGNTGVSFGAHLHFEIWLGGWRVDKASRPIDPLPQLRAWDD